MIKSVEVKRTPMERYPECGEHVKAAAAEISARLGSEPEEE
jgi:hypothetical protein